MITRLLSLLALAAILLGSQAGCERHPASQTVPGFKEKMAREQAALDEQAHTAPLVNPESPKFFPPAKTQ